MAIATRLAMILGAILLILPQSAAGAETPQGFSLQQPPKPLPDISFQDGDGKPTTLNDFRGKVVLLNIWATWCIPCRKEMPTLDRLQAKLGGSDFEVVVLSMDRAGPGVVKKFFAEIGVEHLAVNIDTSAQTMFTLGAPGLPMTLLIDREGKEIGRLIGPADWDSPEMVEFIRGRFAAKQERNSQ
jgi:thiol-disulfide isomerase/thioredoxin